MSDRLAYFIGGLMVLVAIIGLFYAAGAFHGITRLIPGSKPLEHMNAQ